MVRADRISGNEEGIARCFFPCGKLFAIRWVSGNPVTAKIAWPDSVEFRQMQIGQEWERDSSLKKWFPFTAKEVREFSQAIKSYPLIPEDVWIGTNSQADKVQWIVNRCIGSDLFIKKWSITVQVVEWLIGGKYRKIIHRHDGSFRLANEALNIWADGDTLESIVLSGQWVAFRDCTERAP